MKTMCFLLGSLLVLTLSLSLSSPCLGNEISKDYWFVTEDDGSGEVRTYSPFRTNVTFRDGQGNVVSEMTLSPGELNVSRLDDLGFPQSELFCLHVEADRFISCWLTQFFTKTRSTMIYPKQYNTYVYTSGSGEGVSENDYLWIYSETTQEIDFVDNTLGLLYSVVVPAENIVTVDVSEDLGILVIPYVVTILGQEPFVATFHDSPNFVGSIQTLNR